jgi:predicted NUDIX family phosphoesterase
MAQVFAVERAAFFGGEWPQGFVAVTGATASGFLDDAHRRGRFVERAVAEQTPAWKQWIPYCVLRCRSAVASPHEGLEPARGTLDGVFRVERTSGQGEARLHGAWSIGLGGHVEPVDRGDGDGTEHGAGFFERALARELAEELRLGTSLPAPRFVGLLNDEQTPVGRVHAGLVYVCDLVTDLDAARRMVAVREIGKMRGGFGSLVEFGELWQDPSRFESWSQFLVQAGVAGPMGDSDVQELTPGRRAGDNPFQPPNP